MSDCASIRDRFFGEGELDLAHPELGDHLRECADCRLAAQGMPAVNRALSGLSKLKVRPPPFESIQAAAASSALWRRRARAARRSVPYALTGLGVAAAAALIVALFGARLSPNRPPLLAAGTLLEAASGARSAVLLSGARVRIEAGAVRVVPSSPGEERLFLETGSISLEVPKLAAGHTVAVQTPDAVVQVHGTRFQVFRDGKGTSVAVAEGLVEIRPRGTGRAPLFVRPGELATVESPEAYRRGLRAAAIAALGRGEFAAARQPLELWIASEPTPAEQAEASSLLAWSLAGSGDRRGAIERHRRALDLLPEGNRSLWADNACAERALLMEQEFGSAKAAWRECLRLFPDGIHAPLARARAGSRAEP